jgi:hypothetical protein
MELVGPGEIVGCQPLDILAALAQGLQDGGLQAFAGIVTGERLLGVYGLPPLASE